MLPSSRPAQQPFLAPSTAAEKLSTGEPAAFQRVHWNNQPAFLQVPTDQRPSEGECLSCLCPLQEPVSHPISSSAAQGIGSHKHLLPEDDLWAELAEHGVSWQPDGR